MYKVNRKIHCFRCNGSGWSITIPEKCQNISISLLPKQLKTKKLPSMKVHVDEQVCITLINSECYHMLNWVPFLPAKGSSSSNSRWNCRGYKRIKLKVGHVAAIDIEVLVVNTAVGLQSIVGDRCDQRGWWHFSDRRFSGLSRCAAISIDKLDFSVTYDHHNKKWTNTHPSIKLTNSVQEYVVPNNVWDARKVAVKWMTNQWKWGSQFSDLPCRAYFLFAGNLLITFLFVNVCTH